MSKHKTVVTLQGDDYREVEAALYSESSQEDLQKGFLRGSPDVENLFTLLSQWEDGEPRESQDESQWGDDDKTAKIYRGDQEYVVSWNTGMGYAALTCVERSERETLTVKRAKVAQIFANYRVTIPIRRASIMTLEQLQAVYDLFFSFKNEYSYKSE